MTVRKVVRLGHPVLRDVARDVTRKELRSRDFKLLLDDMVDTMHDYRGIGVAAPQVAVALRAFVVEVPAETNYSGQALTAYINPEVEFVGERRALSHEGCLSIPGFRGAAARHPAVRVRALDRLGEPFEVEYTNYTAIVIQHEFDHINGRVYLDRLVSHEAMAFEEESARYGTLGMDYLMKTARRSKTDHAQASETDSGPESNGTAAPQTPRQPRVAARRPRAAHPRTNAATVTS